MSISAGSELKVPASSSSLGSTSTPWSYAVGLDDAVAIATFADEDGDAVIDIKAQLIDISGLGLSLNVASKVELTTSSITTSGSLGYLVRMSDTVALFVYKIRTIASPSTWEIRATVLTESAGSILQNTTVLQTDVTTSYFLGWRLERLTDTTAMWVIWTFDSSVTSIERFNARILTISGSGASATVAAGSLSSNIYESPSTITTSPNFKTCPLTTTACLVQYIEGNDPSGDGFNTGWARVLTNDGGSVTLGTEAEISAYDANSDIFNDRQILFRLGNAKAVSLTVPSTSGNTGWQVLTISGSTISIGTNVDEAIGVGAASVGTGFETDLLLWYDRGTSTANDNAYEYVSVTSTVPAANDVLAWSPSTRVSFQAPVTGAALPTVITSSYTTAAPTGHLYVRAYRSSVTPTPPATDDVWDAAPANKPASIDADGQYIYIAALDSGGTPVLIQFSTALDADGSIVFDPGSGTDIGVECSPTDPDIIWIAGAFDSTNTVERSTDGGGSFVVEDPGTFAPVTAFDVGPDSDERVIVATETTGSIGLVNILETVDGGDNWTERNAGLSTPASILAMDRYGPNPEEVVFGNANNTSDRSDYTPNSGSDLDDITTGTPTYDATGVIVG